MVRHVHSSSVVWLLVAAVTVHGCATAAPPQLPYGGVDVSQSPESNVLTRAWVDSQMPCYPTPIGVEPAERPLLTARARVRGRLERRRIDALLWVGVDWSGRVRLESAGNDRSHFALLATNSFGPERKDEATLVLPGGRRVVRSRSREIIELALGVPLSAVDLQNVLTGCPRTPGQLKFESFDVDAMKIVTTGDTVLEVFMRRDGNGSPWTLWATVGAVPDRPIRWRADPGERVRGVLESVRLTSLEWNGEAGRRFDLTFSFDRIQTPAPALDVFALPLSASPEFVAIDAVRLNRSRPLLAD